MKKIISLALTAAFICGITGCGADDKQSGEKKNESVEISLWTYPVGNWGNPGTVAEMLTSFNRKYPNIRVSVNCLTYEDGDSDINDAVKKGEAPDLVFEGPERIVADWGRRGLMADISDVWEESDSADSIYENVRAACRGGEGEYYEFPICMTAHCMAINYDMFKAAGALKYIDEKNRTWTTDGFKKAVKAVTAHGQKKAGAVYCGGQGGDQGTRALVTNLYGGSYTDSGHTKYTANNPENVKALELLKDLDGISFEPDIVGTDEIKRFVDGDLAMSFCWNSSIELTQTIENPNLDFEILPMTFPTDGEEPNLQGGIWGFGVFDNGDKERLEAAKTFIKFMTDDEAEYAKAVIASSQFPAREDGADIYANDEFMNEYGMFMKYMGDYYQIAKNWTSARAAWWNMLQDVSAGGDVEAALEEFDRKANEGQAGYE